MENGTNAVAVGIVGLGRMGAALSQRLADGGFEVGAWNRSAVSEERKKELAATVYEDLSGLTACSDILVLSLFDDAAVNDVVGQLCQLDLSGKLIVETSTVSPKTLPGLIAQIKGAGASAIDAPIAGGPEMVLAGKVGVYVGGTQPDVDRAKPVLEQFAARVLYMGDIGSGATAKIVNNMALAGFWETLREALMVGRKGGLSDAQMMNMLEGSPVANPMLKSRIPLILGQSDAVGFSVNGGVKDGELFVSVAESLGVEVPAVAAALHSLKKTQEAGFGESDLATMLIFDAEKN